MKEWWAYEKINNKLYRTYRGGKSRTQRKQERNASPRGPSKVVRRESKLGLRLTMSEEKEYAGYPRSQCVPSGFFKSHTQRKQVRNAYEHVRREDVRREPQKPMRTHEVSQKSYAVKASWDASDRVRREDVRKSPRSQCVPSGIFKSHTQRKQVRNAYEHVRREDVRREPQKPMRTHEVSQKSYAVKASWDASDRVRREDVRKSPRSQCVPSGIFKRRTQRKQVGDASDHVRREGVRRIPEKQMRPHGGLQKSYAVKASWECVRPCSERRRTQVAPEAKASPQGPLKVVRSESKLGMRMNAFEEKTYAGSFRSKRVPSGPFKSRTQ